MRAGGQTLTLLGTPRISLILESLAEGKKGQVDLRRDTGLPPQSTLRRYLRLLEAADIVDGRKPDSFPRATEYELTERGRDLLAVIRSMGLWLAAAPLGKIEIGSDPSRAAVKGLVDSWSSTVLTTLSTGPPLSLTELDKRISSMSYPAIERCLETMRLAEQLDVGQREPGGRPYMVTDWLRHGIAPLALAARWEHRHRPEGADPICRLDVEDAVAIMAPLLALPKRLSGNWQLAAKAPNGPKKAHRFLGAVEIQSGCIALRAVYPQVKPDAWTSGTIESWFAAVIEADTHGLKTSGDRALPKAVLGHVHRAFFESETEAGDLSGPQPQG